MQTHPVSQCVMSDISDEEAPASEGGQCNYLAVQLKVNV